METYATKHAVNILLADDDMDDRHLFHLALEGSEPKVRIHDVKNGVEVLSYLATCPVMPDLLFMDINMPVMGGMECLIKIKKETQYNNICVVMCSTSMQKEEIDMTFSSGAHIYIRKPHDFNKLKDIIQNIISLKDCKNDKKVIY